MSDSGTHTLWTPANIVTVIRIVFVPLLMVVMLAPWESLFFESCMGDIVKPIVAAALFLLLSATDGIDGYLARSRNEVTNFGKFMDPLADKLLVITAFLCMIQTGQLPAWVALIVLFREFMVSGLRMMAATKGMVIAASWYGKAKTVTQMIAITLFILLDDLILLFGADSASWLFGLSWTVLVISLILTILSMVDYFVKAKDVFAD